jgi:hypothetical protein
MQTAIMVPPAKHRKRTARFEILSSFPFGFAQGQNDRKDLSMQRHKGKRKDKATAGAVPGKGYDHLGL